MRKPKKGQSLAEKYPELAAQWHPTKNGDLTALDVSSGSNKKVWWKCSKGDDHEWDVKISSRTSFKTGCIICSNRKIVLSNCLATTHPKIASEWHPTKNGSLTPFDIGKGSNKRVWWKCSKGDDHEWEVKTVSRTIFNTWCPFCNGKKVSKSNSLYVKNKLLALQLHQTKNGKTTPLNVTPNSQKVVWWQCPINNKHEWKTSIANRHSQKTNCPICSNKKITISNCLATTHPKIASEWHPTKNGSLTPFDVVIGSSKRVWWKCSKGDDHEWRALIYSRQVRTCPFCTLTPQSKQELSITFELITLFTNINPRGFKSRLEDKIWSIDIYIPLLHLGVEFDGSYWHKDKVALDKLKTKKLEGDGFNILRVREEPLKKISETDIISKQPFNAKEVTNNILIHIMNSFKLEDVLVKKIKAYISKKKLQNEKGLDEYIEMILTEKAEKD